MIDRIKSLFIAADSEDPAIKREIRIANLTRSLITTCGAILLSAAIISIFHQNSPKLSPEEIAWRSSIIRINLCTISFNTFMALLSLYALRYKESNHPLYTYLPYLLLLHIGAWGIAGTMAHQLIASTIIPFMLASFVMVLLLVRPSLLFYYYIVLYFAFSLLLPLYQTDPHYLLLNRVLGLATLIVSYCFSILTWNNNLVRFRQNRLIELQAEALKASNASKDKFFSILSHDLKGPVATSLLLAELLQEDNVGEQERKDIQSLFRNSLENISRLLNNVLLWANNQTGNISFNPTPLELKPLIEEDIQLLAAMAVQKNIAIANEVPEGLRVHADQQMMHTIVRNLLTNAIKFTHAGGQVNVFAESLQDISSLADSQIKLSIVDNGIGIAPELLGDLFKLDKKVATPGTYNETGTGLGLILCKDFVEKHKGQLLVESIPAAGSRFTILLPQLQVNG